VSNQSWNFTTRGMYLTAFCVQEHQKIHFELNLPFSHDIITQKSYGQMEAVGNLFEMLNLNFLHRDNVREYNKRGRFEWDTMEEAP